MNDVMKEYHKKTCICELLEHIAYKIEGMESEIESVKKLLEEEPNESYYQDRIDTLQTKISTLRDIAKKL